VIPLNVEISEDQSSKLEEVIDSNPGWNKTLVVRSLIKYFLALSAIEQEKLIKAHGMKKKAKKRKEEVER
jgi:hypothetical protein